MVKLGAVHKTVRITGPSLLGAVCARSRCLTKPEPTASVPLLYSRAYGGRLRPEVPYEELKPEELDMRNPLGRGFDAAHGGKEDRYPAPQIEYLQSLVQDASFSPDRSRWSVAHARALGVACSFQEPTTKSGRQKVAPHIPWIWICATERCPQ